MLGSRPYLVDQHVEDVCVVGDEGVEGVKVSSWGEVEKKGGALVAGKWG